MNPNDDAHPARPAQRQRCPICGKRAAPAHRPFCSPRCRAVDLGRWLNGSYRVETEERAEDGAAENS
ncbi:MAG: DNA gyrase inhibitor YacG [Alphaproteobacteria bacterium]|nr:DNA gyrase inhibitor YacG [Alphaproteobacteria bacterium]